MANTWITDMTHFLDAEGRIAAQLLSRRLIHHLGSIVAAVTSESAETSRELEIKCRRKPGRKPCPGTIHAGFDLGSSNIAWHCPICEDRGVIHHWQGTLWDKGGRPELPNIHRVTYRRGLLTDPEDLSGLESTVLEGPGLSREIVVAIHDNELLGAAGTYGDPLVGDPLQYDELVIEHAGGTTKITLYNRAIMLFSTDEEFYKQVHRVCCAIDKVVDATQNL